MFKEKKKYKKQVLFIFYENNTNDTFDENNINLFDM